MRKVATTSLVVSMLILTGGLFAHETDHKFSLVKSRAERPFVKWELVTSHNDFLLSVKPALSTLPQLYRFESSTFSRGSRFWEGAKIGALIGGAGLALYCLCANDEEDDGGISFGPSGLEMAILAVPVGAVIGGIIGGIVALLPLDIKREPRW